MNNANQGNKDKLETNKFICDNNYTLFGLIKSRASALIKVTMQKVWNAWNNRANHESEGIITNDIKKVQKESNQ